MDFSEALGEWQPMPPWVRFLIGFGHDWPSDRARPRRIALISMPCDSSGAGLVTLGALIRDLRDPLANDVDGHYEKLLSYARQFLKDCSKCDVKCRPDVKRCGYVKQATGRLRSPLLPRLTMEISDRTDFETGQIRWIQPDGRNNHCVVVPEAKHTVHYHVEDEPPPVWNQPEGEISPVAYRGIIEAAEICDENLRRSFSGLCLAGRAVGENASREICASVRFRNGCSDYGMDDLLTIHGWSASGASRVAFFNPRTHRLDRSNAAPRLVIADGDASFHTVLARSEFQCSDLIGVIHRDMEREKLEALGEKMLPNMWFVQDTEMLCGLPPLPRGISIAVLRRRGD